MVDAVAQQKPWWDSSATSSHLVNDQLYTKPVIDSLAEVLSQSTRSRLVYQQISLTTQLILKTCRQPDQRKILMEAGVLDLLTEKMVAIAALDDPSPESEPRFLHSHGSNTPPALHLSDMLEAIAAIIKDSHYNSARFLYSQSVQNLFGWPKGGNASGSDPYSHSTQQATWDTLIPRLQTLQSKSDPYTRSWPALGSYSSTSNEGFARLPSMEPVQQPVSRNVITDESETPLFTWLMFVARRGQGRERLAACYLLALLKKFGERWSLNDPSKNTRERHFSYLVIPLVVKMIEDSNPTCEFAKKMNAAGPSEKEDIRFILERSPLVLAELVAGNKALQNAAVDARVLQVLVQILKKSFDPITSSSKPLWQPKSSAPAVKDPMIDPASSTLGQAGISADVLHAFRYRESTLLALAAIADSQDGLRKLIIEMGAATHIIESLVPYRSVANEASSSSPSNSITTVKDGSPEPVLVAACKVSRSLSRSVSVLRTSLIDHGIARPCFDLLTHPSVNVQIAATEVITNLVLEVSPMRTVSFNSHPSFLHQVLITCCYRKSLRPALSKLYVNIAALPTLTFAMAVSGP